MNNFKLFTHAKQQLAFKNLAKEMEIPFEIKNEDEIVAGYTPNGQAISVSQHIKNIQNRIDDVKNETAKTYTSQEVLKSILNKLLFENVKQNKSANQKQREN